MLVNQELLHCIGAGIIVKIAFRYTWQAFAMRARGAQVTDIAIIVIAADDDIMPQTKEQFMLKQQVLYL
jgi:hypothetical protein